MQFSLCFTHYFVLTTQKTANKETIYHHTIILSFTLNSKTKIAFFIYYNNLNLDSCNLH